MGKYIYEGHLGSLYASDTALEYDELYCEECGDSDTEIGYAENAEEAFALLMPMTDMFDETLCEDCPHKKDYDYCDEKCEEYAKSGGYSLSYIMSFLHKEFSDSDIFSRIFAVFMDERNKEYVVVGFGKRNEHKHFLPHCYLLASLSGEQSYKNILLSSLPLNSLIYPSVKKSEGIVSYYEDTGECHNIIYTLPVRLKHNEETIISIDNYSYGFIHIDEIDISDDEKEIVRKVLGMSK